MRITMGCSPHTPQSTVGLHPIAKNRPKSQRIPKSDGERIAMKNERAIQKRDETMENPRSVRRFIAILLVAIIAAIIAAIIFNFKSD
jgi:hypothetical protein